MVAGSHGVVTRRVQQRNCIFAVAYVDNRHTVEGVAGVEPKRGGIFSFDGFDSRRQLSQTDTLPAVVGALNAGVHVIGVEDDKLSRRADCRIQKENGNQYA